MTIRRNIFTTILAGATLGALASTAMAADIIQPQIIEAPQIKEVQPFGGWYIRGDVGYAFSDARDEFDKKKGLDPLTPADAEFSNETEFEDMYSAGVGVGYQLNQFLRTDVTATGYFNGAFENSESTSIPTGVAGTDPDVSGSVTSAEFDALTVMANAYVDMGTYAGITPYVGAGVGFASIDYGEISYVVDNGTGPEPATVTQDGEEELRLAWSLAAGASYDVSDRLALDAGYRFTRIAEGAVGQRTIESVNASTGGTLTDFEDVNDGGFDIHEVRVGARYKFH